MKFDTENERLKARFEGVGDTDNPTGTILFETEVGSTLGDKYYPTVLKVNDLSEVEKIDRKGQ